MISDVSFYSVMVSCQHQTPWALFIRLGISVLLIASILSFNAAYGADTTFSSIQKQHLNKLIKQYIYDNPEVIVDSIQRMQNRQKAKEKARAISALKARKKELEADPDDPTIGNPAAVITIVEFFDYRCGYCKHVFPNMMKVLEDKPNVRFVLKEFPILGPESVAASRASLAVWRMNKEKYREFHAALLKTRGGTPKTKILSIADKLGINTNQLLKTMANPKIDHILQKNHRLAEELNINGTPAFIIDNKIISGALDLAAMRKMISAAGG